MSCILNIMGENLDVDTFVNKTGMSGFRKSYKGDPITKKNLSREKKYSSASITTSDLDFDNIKGQIEETINFLTKYKDALKGIAITSEIEYASINFGVDLMIDEEHLIQNFYFPVDLTKICGELGIGIELSIYKEDMQLILEHRRVENLKP